MTAALALYQAAVQELERRSPLGREWLDALRGEAARVFREQGLPHTSAEAWRFTSLPRLTEIAFAPGRARGEPELPGWAASALGAEPGIRLSIVDGRAAPVPTSLPAGLEVLSLREALETAPDLVRQHLARSTPGADGFAALNTAMLEDGLLVRVRAGAEIAEPVQLVVATSSGSEPTVSYPRVVVVAEPESRLTLVEEHVGHGDAPYLCNEVAELSLGDGASLEHVRAYHGQAAARIVARLGVRVASNARYASRVVTLGGALARLDLEVQLTGVGADCTLDGLCVATGKDQVDHHTRVEHVSPGATSTEVYRGIVDHAASAVFDGTIHIHRDAQRSSAHQENRNLLLSRTAVVNSKPHLAIDADDVRATHGATVGRLDPQQLFYLQARGIDAEASRALLTFAFARELLDRIPVASTRARLGRAVLQRLGHASLASEVL